MTQENRTFHFLYILQIKSHTHLIQIILPYFLITCKTALDRINITQIYFICSFQCLLQYPVYIFDYVTDINHICYVWPPKDNSNVNVKRFLSHTWLYSIHSFQLRYLCHKSSLIWLIVSISYGRSEHLWSAPKPINGHN